MRRGFAVIVIAEIGNGEEGMKSRRIHRLIGEEAGGKNIRRFLLLPALSNYFPLRSTFRSVSISRSIPIRNRHFWYTIAISA
ncbi:hypothetical protein YC2023_020431 [Brassica napus]